MSVSDVKLYIDHYIECKIKNDNQMNAAYGLYQRDVELLGLDGLELLLNMVSYERGSYQSELKAWEKSSNYTVINNIRQKIVMYEQFESDLKNRISIAEKEVLQTSHLKK